MRPPLRSPIKLGISPNIGRPPLPITNNRYTRIIKHGSIIHRSVVNHQPPITIVSLEERDMRGVIQYQKNQSYGMKPRTTKLRHRT